MLFYLFQQVINVFINPDSNFHAEKYLALYIAGYYVTLFIKDRSQASVYCKSTHKAGAVPLPPPLSYHVNHRNDYGWHNYYYY